MSSRPRPRPRLTIADDRGRVPFALVAVLLLVTSATLTATMHRQTAGGADPDPGAAIDRSEAAARTAAASAVDRAARAAARDPVVDPANTTYGRVLNDSATFRDYLRVRIYLAVRRALERSTQRVGAVRANASLPAVDNATDLRWAKQRVGLSTNGTRLSVRIRNVTFRASRVDRNRTLHTERRSLRVTVDNPVLTLHDRTELYERSLDGWPMQIGLTGLLYPIVWTRGYAQYGGLPIQNVLANRHVELATNTAALSLQRAVFGRADRDGNHALRRAVLQVGLRDVVAGGLAARGNAWIEGVVAPRPSPTETVAPVPIPSVPNFGPSPEDEMRVGVNRTADVAFGRLLRGDDRPPLSALPNASYEAPPALAVLRNRTYAARAKLATDVDPLQREPVPEPDPPGPEWTLANSSERTFRNVTPTENGSLPAVPEGWHGHRGGVYRVVEHHLLTRNWTRETDNGTETTRTVATYRSVHRVAFRVVDDHAPSDYAPDRPIDPIHERGGPLNGSNLLSVPDRAYERLVLDRGGPNSTAVDVLAGAVDGSPIRLSGERPANLSRWVYEDLVALRERVRNVSVGVQRGAVATTTNPARRLLREVRERRSELVGAPDRYDGVADKVRVAARAAYLARVTAALEAKVDAFERSREGVDEALGEQDTSVAQAANLLENRKQEAESGSIPTGDGPLSVTVEGAPAYLPLAGLDGDDVYAVESGRTYHALVAENINLFTIPYGDVAKAATTAVNGGGGVDLRTAAKTLQGARQTLDDRHNDSLSERHERLRERVNESLWTVLGEARSVGVGNATIDNETLRTAMDRWNTTANRTLAVTDGRAATAIAATLDASANLTDPRRDRVASRLRVVLAFAAAREEVRPPASLVTSVSRTAGTVAKRAAISRLSGALENVSRRYKGKLEDKLAKRWKDKYGKKKLKRNPAAVSAGLPVLPTPASWIATVNYWVVNVGGEYARFTVRGQVGSPGRPVTYTRDGSTVTLDVDGDGRPDRLGNASRVSFSTRAVVNIAVPPGPRGVGDTNGKVFEHSKGWCEPGYANVTADCRAIDFGS